ncbi:sugar-binding domain-containing protein [Pontiella agarivorans]|uniref:Glycoside hydrolase family 2 TIM barrel-domain containing protein n=1 Tax=Pontiella agarivorans TaxID=3038953 RepID=A0ABU5MU97_9BACT|nr:sugar-binding domain-containing protein [Pontiella agarivorans]MDZ8117788.1 glycoside hydrolase family 2 TIM barrel-domain containing protein [Pontiella agarivorans]
MNRVLMMTALAAVSVVSMAQRVADFNGNWRFALDAEGVPQDEHYDDSTWRQLNLPHDWVVENSCQSNLPFYQATGVIPGKGIGWYRKTFETGALAGKKVQVLFDGVYNNSEVWINGRKLGFHPNGYTPFHFDLTPHLEENGTNVLTVKVDHTRYADSRWYTGAGIYRDVELITTDKLHIPIWGTFYSTITASEKSAEIDAEIRVKNDYSDIRKFRVITSILDAEGHRVGSDAKRIKLNGGEHITIEQKIRVENPRRWSIGDPYLYTAKTELVADGETVDASSARIGIRTFKFDPDAGFSLNGSSMKIKGVCLHHDGGLVGSAVPAGVWRRRLEILKEGGCNAIRSAHNPASTVLLDLCDEMGVLVQDEFFDEWDNPKDKRFNMNQRDVHYETQGYGEHFQVWAEKDLKSTVLSHRNHPSIIQWSIGNEIEWTYPRNKAATGFFNNMNWDGNYFWSEPPFSTEEIKHQLATLPRGRYDIGETAQKLSRWTKELDTTRPVTANCILPSASHFSGYADALDMVGYSYRRVLYDYGHRILPDKPIMGTENVPQYHEWKAVMDRDHIAGTFLWTGIDYMGEVRGDYPVKVNGSGMLDTAGFKKGSWHMYRTLWRDEPHLAFGINYIEEIKHRGKALYELDADGNAVLKNPDSWKQMLWSWQPVFNHWNFEEGRMTVVELYTNCEEAELLLNGKSLGRKKQAAFEDHIVKWAVPFEEGTLTARGWKDGKRFERTLSTHGEPVGMTLRTENRRLKADGYDVAHIVVQLQDEQGFPVYTENREITFSIPEGLKRLGVDNGAADNVQDFQSDTIRTHKGRALLIVQATDAAGEYVIRASGEGLSDAAATVITER